MKNIIIFILMSLLINHPTFGKSKAYFINRGNFFSQDIIVIDGVEYYNSSGSIYNIDNALKTNSLAYEEVKLYKSRASKADMFLFGDLGAAIGYILLTPREQYQSGIYWGLFGVGFVGGIYNFNKAKMHLYNSINYYNDTSNMNRSPNDTTITFSIGTSGPLLSLQF